MKDKYNFSFHLKMVGDWVETHALSLQERLNITKAAHIWAYRKKWQVTVETVGVPNGRGIRVTLKAKYR